MIFVLYQDSEHEDTEAFLQVYESVAQEYLEHKVTSFQWFTIDTQSYPELEDYRDDRAIFTEEGTKKSSETGQAQGSYVSVHYNGNHQTLDYQYESLVSEDKNKVILRKQIVGKYIHPVQKINKCADIPTLVESQSTRPHSLVLFQMLRDDDEQ